MEDEDEEMVDIELELDDDLIVKLLSYARENMPVYDLADNEDEENILINWSVNDILKRIIKEKENAE